MCRELNITYQDILYEIKCSFYDIKEAIKSHCQVSYLG